MSKNHGSFGAAADIKLKKSDLICSGENKFVVQGYLGCGTFADVYKIEDLYSNNQFAIKIFKNGICYLKVGMNEAFLLKKLRKYENYFVVFYEEFFYKQRFCIVQQLLSYNLYELIKSTKSHGFDHGTTKSIVCQLLDALFVLQMERITHGDIKPENICLEKMDEKNFKVKIIDFGSSFLQPRKNAFYVQSRYYRAPETILGLDYGRSIDIWSLACVIFEMFAGTTLFPGRDNREQISRYTRLLGMPSTAMLENGKNTSLYFCKIGDGSQSADMINHKMDGIGCSMCPSDKENNHASTDHTDGRSSRWTDPFTNTQSTEHASYRLIYNSKDSDHITRTVFRQMINTKSKNMVDNANLIDLLFTMLKINPMERPVVEDLKIHPYFEITTFRHEHIQTWGRAKRNIAHPMPGNRDRRRKSVYDIRSLRSTDKSDRKFSVFDSLDNSEDSE